MHLQSSTSISLNFTIIARCCSLGYGGEADMLFHLLGFSSFSSYWGTFFCQFSVKVWLEMSGYTQEKGQKTK